MRVNQMIKVGFLMPFRTTSSERRSCSVNNNHDCSVLPCPLATSDGSHGRLTWRSDRFGRVARLLYHASMSYGLRRFTV
jgi:hypothetical protein